MPGTPAFMEEYRAAIAAANDSAPRQARTLARGSFGYLCRLYYASATFKALEKARKIGGVVRSMKLPLRTVRSQSR